MAHWHRYGVAVGIITAMVGCGSPPPDHPASGHTAGSADADPAAHEPARQDPMQTSPLGPTAQQAPKRVASITDNPRAATPTDKARVRTAASQSDIQQLDRQSEAERAQREAPQSGFAGVSENPGITAQKSGEELDGEDLELDGNDEQARASEEELMAQQLPQEASVPNQEERPGPEGALQ